MKRTPTALLLLTLWVAGIVTAGAFAQRYLAVSSDLRLFLPVPATTEQRLLLEGIGEGPSARVLVIALSGASKEVLANASRAMVEGLSRDAAFLVVANGDISLDAFPDELLPYRYLLTTGLDGRELDANFLKAALDARARDLASPAGLFLEPWLPRDPTLELLNVLEQWQPAREPRRELGVWFDENGERALLIVEADAPAFDPDAQRAILGKLDSALASTGAAGVQMVVSGAGRFSVLMEERVRTDVRRLGLAATVSMIVLLLLAYREAGSVVLSALPLASAGLAGLATVTAWFGSVHGITLAFGFTLIGVAQDYPLHLLSHRRGDRPVRDVARALWPTLATGVASTCIAYLTFMFAGVTGLEQLACFAVTGLVVAALLTRYVLPAITALPKRDLGHSPRLERVSHAISGVSWPTSASALVAAACAAVIVATPAPLWDNELSGLTPVPADLLAADDALRAQLGAADLRYMLVIEARDDDDALTRAEALGPALDRLVERRAIAGFNHAARYLPSAATQRMRQSALPDADTLRAALEQATAATPFRADAFAPFAEDVARARALAPLTVEQVRAAGFSAAIDALLRPANSGGVAALVTFSRVTDFGALRELASASGATLLDLKQASESLVAEQRTRILWSLGAAALLLVGVVAVALRDWARIGRVLAPLALTTLVVVATLQLFGISLTLFHLISLILVAGLGLDYALFFERAAGDRVEQLRTLHAVLVCSLSTLLVFALLAISSLPVLRAIGLPVAVGVASNFVLAMLLTRRA